MMKKLILVFIVLAVLFTGCGVGAGGNPTDTGNITSGNVTKSPSNVTPPEDSETPGPTQTGEGESAHPTENTDVTNTESTPIGSEGTGSTNTMQQGNTTAPSVTTVPPTSNISTQTGQTLRYWVNFPTKGTVKTLTANSFTVSNATNTVSITAYNKDGTVNKGASVSSLGTWLNSYEILDSKGNVVKSGSSKAKLKTFYIDFYFTGGCTSDMKPVKFTGYHKEYDGSNAVVVHQDVTSSFKIISSTVWSYSAEYSTYPTGIISVSTSGTRLDATVKLVKGKTVYLDNFREAHFVYTPVNTVNNGIPTMIINVDTWNDLDNLLVSGDRNVKDIWSKGSYAIIEGTKKTYNTKAQKGTLEIKRRGFTSFTMPKKPYTLKLTEQQVLTDMKANKDWVLASNFADKTLLRNYFAYNLGKSMNFAYVPSCRNVELYIGTGGSSTYLGTYLLIEKIEVAKSKLDIKEMTSADTSIGYVSTSSSRSKILAGSFVVEIETFDRFGKGDTGIGTVFPLNVKSPGKSVLKPDTYSYYPTQNTNLADYIDSFFWVVDSAVAAAASNNDKVFEYLDIDSFVDYYILNELAQNVDGNLRLSTYFHKDKGGKLMVTIWDFDITFGNCDYGDGEIICGDTTGLYMQKNTTWFRRLMRNNTFRTKVQSRWKELRKSGGILSDAKMTSLINSEVSRINNSAKANFVTWNILGEYVWPNHWTIVGLKTYQQNVDHFVNWVKTRAAWLDSNIGNGGY